jgi:hypothetical protein
MVRHREYSPVLEPTSCNGPSHPAKLKRSHRMKTAAHKVFPPILNIFLRSGILLPLIVTVESEFLIKSSVHFSELILHSFQGKVA